MNSQALCVVPEKRRPPAVNLFRSAKYPNRFREHDGCEPAAHLCPRSFQGQRQSFDVTPEPGWGSFTSLPAKTAEGSMAQKRSYETFRALQQKIPFPPIRHALSTRYSVADMHTYHYFNAPISAIPLTQITLLPQAVHAGRKAWCTKNPQLQSAAGRRIGHSRLLGPLIIRENVPASVPVWWSDRFLSVSLRTLYRMNRKRCFPGIGLSKF